MHHMCGSCCTVNEGFKLAMHAECANAAANMVKHQMLPCLALWPTYSGSEYRGKVHMARAPHTLAQS